MNDAEPTLAIPALDGLDGIRLPAVGFGTYTLNGESGAGVAVTATENGYRLLDSAARYGNEGAMGAAVRRSPIARDELILTSKLPGSAQRYDDAIATIEESVFRTGLDHIDLYLIHWPNPGDDLYVEAWTALIEARRRGLLRWIGVCNFLPEHLDRLQAETGVLPAVNQIEMHPYFPQAEQRAYHARTGILTEAWSPLGRGSDMMCDPVIAGIAAAHEVSPAQVILRWHVQNDAIPLPKAASPDRQRENLDLFGFELSGTEVAAITGLGRPDGRIENQDPATYTEY